MIFCKGVLEEQLSFFVIGVQIGGGSTGVVHAQASRSRPLQRPFGTKEQTASLFAAAAHDSRSKF